MSQAQWHKTACNLCYVNCGLEVAIEDGRIAKVRGDKSNPKSQGYLCNKAASSSGQPLTMRGSIFGLDGGGTVSRGWRGRLSAAGFRSDITKALYLHPKELK